MAQHFNSVTTKTNINHSAWRVVQCSSLIYMNLNCPNYFYCNNNHPVVQHEKLKNKLISNGQKVNIFYGLRRPTANRHWNPKGGRDPQVENPCIILRFIESCVFAVVICHTTQCRGTFPKVPQPLRPNLVQVSFLVKLGCAGTSIPSYCFSPVLCKRVPWDPSILLQCQGVLDTECITWYTSNPASMQLVLIFIFRHC